MRAVGIIMAVGNVFSMKELTKKRAIAAMPIAGSYRSIDFVLSSMSNSNIQKVAVFTQYNAISLNEYLSSSKWWNFGRKQGGLYLYAPSITSENSYWYQGTSDTIYQNIEFLKRSHEPYVVIAPGDSVYKIDFNKSIEYHIRKNADITIVCKDLPNEGDYSRFGLLELSDDGKVINMEEKPMSTNLRTVSTGIYILRRQLLIELVEKAASEYRYDFVNDILMRYKNIKRIYGYKIEDYWKCISTVDEYYKTNMDFLEKGIRDYFFREYPEVYSRADDFPPAKYNINLNVKNSIISSGCIINGSVEDSVLFRKVFIGNNCTVKNSIILNDVHIGDNAYIENCIIESSTTIRPNTTHIGNNGKIEVVCST